MVNIFHQDIAKSEVSPSKDSKGSKESKAQVMELSMDGELYDTLFTFRTMWVWINTYENTIFRGMNIHKSQLF